MSAIDQQVHALQGVTIAPLQQHTLRATLPRIDGFVGTHGKAVTGQIHQIPDHSRRTSAAASVVVVRAALQKVRVLSPTRLFADSLQ